MSISLFVYDPLFLHALSHLLEHSLNILSYMRSTSSKDFKSDAYAFVRELSCNTVFSYSCSCQSKLIHMLIVLLYLFRICIIKVHGLYRPIQCTCSSKRQIFNHLLKLLPHPQVGMFWASLDFLLCPQSLVQETNFHTRTTNVRRRTPDACDRSTPGRNVWNGTFAISLQDFVVVSIRDLASGCFLIHKVLVGTPRELLLLLDRDEKLVLLGAGSATNFNFILD